MQLGMPYVQVSNGLHLDYSGYTPLCVYGWPHEKTPAALTRNREGVAKWTDLLKSVNGGIKAHSQSVGLKIDWNDLSSTLSPFASITQTPSAFGERLEKGGHTRTLRETEREIPQGMSGSDPQLSTTN
jgi:zeaxanthin glucosyltransferase